MALSPPPPAADLSHDPVDPAGPRHFKKHKPLPRPQSDPRRDSVRRSPKKHPLSINPAASANMPPHASHQHPSSPQNLKHQLRRIGTGPDLPPTPPTQSRTCSSSHSAMPSSPTSTQSSLQLTEVDVAIQRPPATPPDQRSPPTPDVTPPHPATLVVKPLRPAGTRERGASVSTVAPDSRTESFTTAREDVTSSEDDSAKSATRSALPSSTSQATIVRIPDAGEARRITQQQPYDVAPKRLSRLPQGDDAPRTKREFSKFDGEWGSASEAEHSRDERLQRIVTSKKHQPASDTRRMNGHRDHHVIQDNLVVPPTNATIEVRQMALQEEPAPPPPPRHSSNRRAAASDGEKEGTAMNMEAQRLSGISSISAQSVSSVVEVFLVNQPPKRQRTLRHVRKQSALRDTVDNHSSSTRHSPDSNRSAKLPKCSQGPPSKVHRRHESNISTTTNTTSRSLSSGRARRDVWKSGAIPVVVVPDRRSSRGTKPHREPSLRSTSSRHSRRTSLGSSPVHSPFMDAAPVFEWLPRRSRAFSESDRSERTIDFPPAIPTRSSSLSAPTSRNASRAGSMTANSVQAQIAVQKQSDRQSTHEVHIINPSPPPETTPASPDMGGLERQGTRDTLGLDRHDDGMSSRKYSSRNTPFSVASMETCGTAPELSEALAVHMYPHQNSSVLMVDNAAPPLDGSVATRREAENQKRLSEPPEILTTSPDQQVPVTPPQKQFLSVDVESPLRNPRAPPEPPTQPPAINFIPATPSGMTPDPDRVIRQGNYFESIRETPPRRPSIVKRAFSRRRHVDYSRTGSKTPGLLTRTFSLSRNVRKGANRGIGGRSMHREDDRPAEENKLHPFWRPQWYNDEDSDDDADEAHGEHDDEDEIYRYPPVDNRPRTLTRSLSAKMKRTFAILPQEYPADDMYGPQRRTIRRTPSGNLRVMRRRASAESMKRPSSTHGTPDPAPNNDKPHRRGLSRSYSLGPSGSVKGSRRFSLGRKLEDIQNIPQMLSERRRERRSQRLRQMISGPRDVRDGVGEVIRRSNTGGGWDGTARPF